MYVYINNFQRRNENIFLPIRFYICFGCSIEPSHRDGSFEHHNIFFDQKIGKKIFGTLLFVLMIYSFLNCDAFV